MKNKTYDKRKPRRHSKLIILSILLLQTAIPPFLSAMDLMEAYTSAKKSDPLFGSFIYEHEAAKTLSNQGLSLLLPRLQVSGALSRVNFITAPAVYIDYNAETLGVQFTQSVFNLPKFYEYQQDNVRKTAGDMKFAGAEQDLILRVAQAYFDGMAAKDSLEFVDAEKKAVLEHLERAKRTFQAGMGTIIDVRDAEARYDSILSKEIENKYNLEAKMQALRRLVAIEPDGLSFLKEDFPLMVPEPDSREAWIEISKKHNPVLKYYAYNIDSDKHEVRKNWGQHFPSVDLLAQYSDVNTNNYLPTGRLSYWFVGVQVSVPIFTGGYISAKVQESQAKFEQTKKTYENALLDNTQKLTEAFLGVKGGIAKINSLLTAVRSASTALQADKMGLIAGVRTFVEVLNAERDLQDIRRQLGQARYDYIMNTLKLKFYGGTLSEEDVIMINQWLQTRGEGLTISFKEK
jgi:outer membrane protein